MRHVKKGGGKLLVYLKNCIVRKFEKLFFWVKYKAPLTIYVYQVTTISVNLIASSFNGFGRPSGFKLIATVKHFWRPVIPIGVYLSP